MKKTYFIANYKGEIIAHDIFSRKKAELICANLIENQPNEEWEVLST